MNLSWIILFVAGLLETGWAVGLKYTDGFTQFWASVWTIIALIASMILLSIAVRDLPIGTAYPVWVGIGAVGSALFGMFVLNESVSATRIFFLLLLVAAIIGLKATSEKPSSKSQHVDENLAQAAVPTSIDS